jgi:S1-C subfamily serine protease
VELPALQQQVLEREQAIGLLLVGVDRDSPAARAGLLVGDILVGFAGQLILDPDDLLPRLIGDVVGSTVEIEILRGEDRRVVPVIIGERRS